jgi:hypothetical protein
MQYVPPELRLALADRSFVQDGSRRWSPEHALRVLGDERVGAVRPAIEALEAALLPVERRWLGDRLTLLWTMFMASRTTSDPDAVTIWMAEYIRLLGDLPHDIAEAAIDGAVRGARHGFIPSVGEVRAIADPLLVERQEQLSRLRLVEEALGGSCVSNRVTGNAGRRNA